MYNFEVRYLRVENESVALFGWWMVLICCEKIITGWLVLIWCERKVLLLVASKTE